MPSNMRGSTLVVLLCLLVPTFSQSCGNKRPGLKKICVSEGIFGNTHPAQFVFVLDRNSTRLNMAGFYILSNNEKFYIPEKVKVDCTEYNDRKECPKRCEYEDDGVKVPGICYEKVCPPVRPCLERGGQVLMVRAVSTVSMFIYSVSH